MADLPRKPATYADIEALPDHIVGEIIYGALRTHPRPSPRHGATAGALGAELTGAFQKGSGGPGGWVFFVEPEIKFGDDLLVPDIAGWRRDRLPGFPEKNWFTIAPEGCWTKIGDRNSDDEVRAPPFDAISFSLADLWPLDPPPGLNEDPTPYYAGDR